jgi:heat shock transcription factor
MSEEDPPGSDPESSDPTAHASATAAAIAPVLDSSAVSAPPGSDGDTFVSSILARGPSLAKQLSLGFLDSMDSAEIGEMVRDMQIGAASQQNDDIAQRVSALTDV